MKEPARKQFLKPYAVAMSRHGAGEVYDGLEKWLNGEETEVIGGALDDLAYEHGQDEAETVAQHYKDKLRKRIDERNH